VPAAALSAEPPPRPAPLPLEGAALLAVERGLRRGRLRHGGAHGVRGRRGVHIAVVLRLLPVKPPLEAPGEAGDRLYVISDGDVSLIDATGDSDESERGEARGRLQGILDRARGSLPGGSKSPQE